MNVPTTEHEIAMLCANVIKQICVNHSECTDCPFRTKNGDCAVAPGLAAQPPAGWDKIEKN